jgi:hypothetical protein
VFLPDEFVRHALATPLPKSLPQMQSPQWDIEYWIQWANQFHAGDPNA